MQRFKYAGPALKEISFPLGGIGTGSVGLSGTGRLIDWEIFNRPNKQSLNGFSHLAIKAEEDGRVLDARVLNSDLLPSFMGEANGFGFGPSRYTLAGVPHFRSAEFDGHYPRAAIRFDDESFPGQVILAAWNPFIPLNDLDSSLPLAVFEISVTNSGQHDRDYVCAFTINNPLPEGTRHNEFTRAGDLNLLQLLSTQKDACYPDYGDLTCAVQTNRASCQQNWFNGSWFDNLAVFWEDFTRPGDLKNRIYPPEILPVPEKFESVATLAARITLAAGATGTIRFVLAWNFPNAWNYWNPVEPGTGCCAGETTGSGGSGCCSGNDSTRQPPTWKNYYATQFKDSSDTCRYFFANQARLERETSRFMDILYRASLPDAALEALAANLSLLRTPTCLRLPDGSFYGFEGCSCQSGCCEGSCTHVWNYAYVLPYLFPRLERSMRELDYRCNISPAGAMSFRLQLPPGRERSKFRPCADGQMGGVVKVYREWLICGDTGWLRRIWPDVRKSLEYAWSPDNGDLWDPEQLGYLSGRQHHTLDMELFGPNSWLSGFYLAALDAGARMAEALGEDDNARKYRDICERGRVWVDRNLFNGEYFIQKIDLKDASLLDRFPGDPSGVKIRATYWQDESNELKYQVAEGSLIDQVLAQWHCDLIGLGDVFARDKIRTALASIYRCNYQASFRKIFNPCRLYSLNDEAGTMICAWPEGKRKPLIPVPYSEETMPGFEYQAGCHMIMNGLEAEGLQLVQAVRDRFDGQARNPWNEFECGSNYARSMASYALMLAYSGFRCDMTRQHLQFSPLHPDQDNRFLWSVDAGWGEIILTARSVSLILASGHLPLRSLAIPRTELVRAVSLNQIPLPFQTISDEVHLTAAVILQPEDILTIDLAETSC